MDLLGRLPPGVYWNESNYLVNSSTLDYARYQYSETSNGDRDLDPDEIQVMKIVRPYIVGANTLLFIFGLFVNILLIAAIRLSPRLKAPIFQLQFSMIFADLILLFSFALPEVSWFLKGDIWLFGSNGCTALLLLQFLAAHVTMCLIVICCGERFYAVCRPHSALWMTSRKMSGIIAVTWVVNAAALAPVLLMSKPLTMTYSDGVVVPTCRFQMAEHIRQIYLTVMGMVFFGMTTIISIVFLACTVCKVRNIDLEQFMVKDDFKNHILRTVATTTALTVISWLPYRYIYFYKIHGSSMVAEQITALSIIFVLLSGAAKPLIYIIMSSQFRKAVLRALKCCNRNQVDYEATHEFKMKDALEMQELEPL